MAKAFSPGGSSLLVRPGARGRSPQAADFRPLTFMHLRADASSGWMRSLLAQRKRPHRSIILSRSVVAADPCGHVRQLATYPRRGALLSPEFPSGAIVRGGLGLR